MIDCTSRQFAFKQIAVELSRAVARLIDYEFSVRAGYPKPDLVTAAQTLIKAACMRLGYNLQSIESPFETIIYHVEVQLESKKIRKFVYLPRGIDCQQYLEARECGSPEYVCSKVIRTVSEEERDGLKESFKRVELSPDAQERYDKIRLGGLLEAMERIFDLSDYFKRNRPKDTFRCIENFARVAIPVKWKIDTYIVDKLKQEMRCPFDAKITLWYQQGIVFIVADDNLRAVTLDKSLHRIDTWTTQLIVLNPPGIPWVSLRMATSENQ